MVLRLLIFALGVLIYIALVVFFRSCKQWLPYYVLGAFGLTLILVLVGQYLRIDRLLIISQLRNVSLLANAFEMPTKVFGPTSLMVTDPTGVSLLEITIECSAILESSVLIGLLLFYPTFTWAKKFWRTLFGVGAVYVINLARLMIIVTIVYGLGEGMVFIAHAVIGRLFFFVSVIALFWYIITRPTLNAVGQACRSS